MIVCLERLEADVLKQACRYCGLERLSEGCGLVDGTPPRAVDLLQLEFTRRCAVDDFLSLCDLLGIKCIHIQTEDLEVPAPPNEVRLASAI